MLAKVKSGSLALFGLLHPYSMLDTKGVLVELEERDSTKVPFTNPSQWELICSEFHDIFEKPSTPSERAIEYKIDLLPYSVPPAKRYFRILPVELAEVGKQLDENLSKGWIRPRTSPNGGPFFLLGKRMEP